MFVLATAGCAAVGADETTFLINKGVLTAVGTTLGGSLAIVDITLEGALYTHLPSIDGLAIQFQTAHQFEYLRNGHTIAQYA